MATSVSTRLETAATALERAGVAYESLAHEPTQTALAEARALDLTPGGVAKTILVKTPAGHLRAVLPAAEKLDLRKVRGFLGLKKGDARLLTEDELVRDYPEFELGAVPPFGGAHADRVLVDCRLVDREQLVLEAGTHRASLRMASHDLLRVTGAEVLDICQED